MYFCVAAVDLIDCEETDDFDTTENAMEFGIKKIVWMSPLWCVITADIAFSIPSNKRNKNPPTWM